MTGKMIVRDYRPDSLRLVNDIYNLNNELHQNMERMVELGRANDYVGLGELLGQSIWKCTEVMEIDDAQAIRNDTYYGESARRAFEDVVNIIERKRRILAGLRDSFARHESAQVAAWANIREELLADDVLDGSDSWMMVEYTISEARKREGPMRIEWDYDLNDGPKE